MAFTVQEAYEKTVEEADKMGSDLLSLPVFLKMFKAAAIEFVGARAAEVERTQQITTDIQNLVVPTKRTILPDPDNPGMHIASFPNDFMERVRVNIQYSDFSLARQPLVARHGEVDNAMINPDKRAEKDYPIVSQHSNLFSISTGIPGVASVQPLNLILTYVKFPTIGQAYTSQIADLNDTVVTLLISRVANQFRNEKGDPSATNQIQWTESFRKK